MAEFLVVLVMLGFIAFVAWIDAVLLGKPPHPRGEVLVTDLRTGASVLIQPDRPEEFKAAVADMMLHSGYKLDQRIQEEMRRARSEHMYAREENQRFLDSPAPLDGWYE